MRRFFLLFLSSVVALGFSELPLAHGQRTDSPNHLVLRTLGKSKGKGFHVEHNFAGKDGSFPTAALIQDATGNLYGTTSAGGSGLGVLFKLDSSGNESFRYAFSGPDGATPFGHVIQDSVGNLYGTTYAGGASGFGTVFKVDTNGIETVLHSFSGKPDGAHPYAGLVMDSGGNLYGTTEKGGDFGLGTVFKVDTSDNESVLHSFAGGSNDGSDPRAALILDASGNLYGTTFSGGSANKGTVFELDVNNIETILHSFSGGTDGGNPFGGVVLDSDGTLYGTTEIGGAAPTHYGCCKSGVVFGLYGANHTEKVLHTFIGKKDGATPTSDLVLYNGALYGTTALGGHGNKGTVFAVTIADRSERILHDFTGKSDGGIPHAGLFIDKAGTIYGTSLKGGHFRKGTVYRITQ